MKRVNKTIIEEKLRERKQKIIEKLIQTELKVHKKDIKKHKKNTMIQIEKQIKLQRIK